MLDCHSLSGTWASGSLHLHDNLLWAPIIMKCLLLSPPPGSSIGKESTCNSGDLGWIPGLGRSSGEGNGYPLQYSGLENPIDRRASRLQSMGLQSVLRGDVMRRRALRAETAVPKVR